MEHIIDATDQTLGRLATKIAHLLQEKQKVGYNPRFSGTDKIIIKNASKLSVTGKKANQKIYYHHTGYLGHLRERKFKVVFEKSPEEVLRKAVANMLPKNRLRQKRLNRLTIER
jgi:large subunit ribosomal protein L13